MEITESILEGIRCMPHGDSDAIVNNAGHNARFVEALKSQYPQHYDKFVAHKIARYTRMARRMLMTEQLDDFVEIEIGNDRMRFRSKHIGTLIASIRIEDGCVTIGEPKCRFKFCTEDFFQQCMEQLIEKEIKPYFVEAYKQEWISVLPKCIEITDNINIGALTKESLASIFNSACLEQMNGEQIIEGETGRLAYEFEEQNGGIVAAFSVACGRYGVFEGCSIKVNRFGKVQIDLSDTPLEGAVETTMAEMIIEKIKK